jgi:hypothetical protein
LYFDTVVYDSAPLRYLVSLAGAAFDEATSHAIVSGNACRLFGIG